MRPNSGLSGATIHLKKAGRPQEFAAETSTASGESKAQVNKHLARAEALGADLDEIDKGAEIDADRPPCARRGCRVFLQAGHWPANPIDKLHTPCRNLGVNIVPRLAGVRLADIRHLRMRCRARRISANRVKRDASVGLLANHSQRKLLDRGAVFDGRIGESFEAGPHHLLNRSNARALCFDCGFMVPALRRIQPKSAHVFKLLLMRGDFSVSVRKIDAKALVFGA